MTVKKGDKIKVDYTGTLEDGTVFDTSEGKQPLELSLSNQTNFPYLFLIC